MGPIETSVRAGGVGGQLGVAAPAGLPGSVPVDAIKQVLAAHGVSAHEIRNADTGERSVFWVESGTDRNGFTVQKTVKVKTVREAYIALGY